MSPFLPLLDLYGDPEVDAHLSEAARVESWLEVERALADAQADCGLIPAAAAAAIGAAARGDRIDAASLAERSRLVGYPILPLLEQVIAGAPEEVGRYIHWGATTQDIMDTGDALRFVRVLDLLDRRVVRCGDALAELTERFRDTPMAGRTHGQQAVPTTLGAKLAVWLAELVRHRERLAAVRPRVGTVELFGAAGTGAAMGAASAEVRTAVAARLGLGCTAVPGHTARDDLAEMAFVAAAAAATCGKIGREVRELARTEIAELHETVAPYRGASSTMPQKQNPIDSEVIVGLSMIVTQVVPTLLAAMQAVHERATGEWQAEWDALPIVLAGTAGALTVTATLLEGLEVDPVRMRTNLQLDGGRIMAEAAMMALAPVVGRASAHELVYEASTLATQDGVTFRDALDRVLRGSGLEAELDPEQVLDPERYLGEAPAIAAAAVAEWRASL